MKQNQFSDEKIFNQLNNLEQKAKILNQDIDTISSDIKKLEEQLQNLNVPIATQFLASESLKLSASEQQKISMYQDIAFKAQDFLEWNKQPTGKFRIMYNRILLSDEIPGLKIDILNKPLIECSMETRMKMHSSLHQLVQEIEANI